MFMRKQMLRTILIISFAFGAETECQIRIGFFRLSANGTFMMRLYGSRFDLDFIIMLSLDFLRRFQPAAFRVNEE